MTFYNQFILSVRDQNKNILREYDHGKVYLPFYTEYSLFIKNNNNVRCECNVKIDGTDVLGGEKLVINAYSSTDLERFISNGDLTKGKCFKFVPANDSQVQDPTSGQNGIVEVTFHKEIVLYPTYQPTIFMNSCTTDTVNHGMMRSRNCSDNVMFACSATGGISGQSMSDVGATVEGSHSSQQFTTVSGFSTEPLGTTLRLQLVGSQKSVTSHDTKKVHCTSCGRKVKFNDNYCGSCGVRV